MKTYAGQMMAISLIFFLAIPFSSAQAASEHSGETEACLECHKTVSPGIVADWQKSWHAKTTPSEAVKKDPKSLKVSAQQIPSGSLQKGLTR